MNEKIQIFEETKNSEYEQKIQTEELKTQNFQESFEN